jgi:membrane-associated phospholipid phosphatase
LAFAIATPFAQAYDQPWLYGLAASTAVGRLQSREHWLSDTVVGGLMGYAIGSLAYQQQQPHRTVPRLSVGDRSVTASWSF